MRIASVVKSGFYPADPEAVTLMLRHLRLPEPPPERSLFKSTDITICDPCAGDGEALQIISEGLSISPGKVHAVELNAGRTDLLRARLPEARVAGPCSFFGADIGVKSFSLMYVNPPFDYDGSGTGTREEQNFVRRSYDLLAPKGVIVIVCPYNVIIGQRSFATMIDSMFEHVEIYKFPDACRHYNEVCIFGTKRDSQMDDYSCKYSGDLGKRGWYDYDADGRLTVEKLPALGEVQPLAWKLEAGPSASRWGGAVYHFAKIGERESLDTWTLPLSWAPRRFLKSSLTEDEKFDLLRDSPLWWQHLRDPEPAGLPECWMEPYGGHTIQLMVSGMLDGLVPSNPPHVARGYFTKKEKRNAAKCSVEVNEETGAATETIVMTEETIFCTRCLEMDETGEPRIFEFSSDAEEGADNEDEEDEE